NPYVAFRRRTEKMQTRKNRKNDETSYEKMLKLRRDLSRAVNLLDFVKHREKLKREHLKCSVDVYEKRYQMGDFSGQIISEVSALRHIRPSSTYLSLNNQSAKMAERGVGRPRVRNEEHSQPRRKRVYKRRDKRDEPSITPVRVEVHDNDYVFNSSDDEADSTSPIADQMSDQEEQEDPDGIYAFKRKRGCSYYAPLIDRLGNWPWASPLEGGSGDRRYRLHLDRAYTPLDPFWSEFSRNTIPNGFPSNELLSEIKNEWLHFRPRTPPQESSSLCYLSESVDNNEYDAEGNVIPVVSITSLKEFVDENSITSNGIHNEIDIESFHKHQEELIEMQRKQMERLKHNHQTGGDTTTTPKSGTYSVCNSEHSSHSSSTKAVTSSPKASPMSSPVKKASKVLSSDNWPIRSTPTALQFSTLDSASVQFAVSVVRSASELTANMSHNRTQTHNTCANDSSKETQLNSYANNCEKQYISDKPIGASNGPIHGNDLYRKTINSELSLPSTASLTTSTTGPELDANDSHSLTPITPHPTPHQSPHPTTHSTSTPTSCKLKFQNRSQKTNTSIPPTDVT
ncbi:unnamed protein product, partial [Medioppia subpectinata]